MSKILLFVVLICLVNLFAFLLVPSFSYTFNLESFSKEPWRFLTFQFFHVDIFHLIENIIGFIFISLIAIELSIDFKSFFLTYILSVFIVVLPIAVFFPLATVAGNSTGIYGILALSLIKSRKLVSTKITLPLILAFMFSLSITNFIQCGMCFIDFFKGEFFHFSGFLLGIFITFMPKAKPKHVLRI